MDVALIQIRISKAKQQIESLIKIQEQSQVYKEIQSDSNNSLKKLIQKLQFESVNIAFTHINILISIKYSMSKTQHDYEQLKDIYNTLIQTVTINRNKNENQKAIYRQIIKAFHLFSKQLQTIATKINQQIIKSELTDQYENNTYQYLSNSLLRFGECSRKVAGKCKNQVLDPFALFAHNYYELNFQQLKKVQDRINNIKLHTQQLQIQKQNYRMANLKLQKQKEQQTKMMLKIQTNGVQSQNQLTKFNLGIKKLVENISLSQKFYLGAVQKMNYEWVQAKEDLQRSFVSLNYNEESRNSFCRKSAIYCIKSLEEFQNAIDTQVEKKIEDSSKNLNTQKIQNEVQKKLKIRINILSSVKTQQQYTSYEQEIKQSRKQSMLAEQSHLVDIFQKVKQSDKVLLKHFIRPWFAGSISKSKMQEKSQRNSTQEERNSATEAEIKIQEKELQVCKQKIVSNVPYMFYFIEIVYFKVAEMNSIYCKLDDEAFNYLNHTFTSIINSLDIEKNNIQYNIQFVYKIIQISQRIMKKKSPVQNSKSQPIQLSCHYISKNSNKFKNLIVLKRIYNFIEKKREDKKKQGKGMIGSLTKGLFAVVTGKKDPVLNEDEQFSCLQQFCNIMSNLNVPTQVSLPFIKQILGSQNQPSFEYLKSMILTKKDVAERQKIFYKTQIKEKLQKQIGYLIKNNKIAQFCIALTARQGYLGLESVKIRQTSKYLSLVHQQILHNMKIPTTVKWPRMIPRNSSMNFQQLASGLDKYKDQQIDQIIGLDVNRSLHMHTEYLKPEILTQILKLYAYTHKEISYCQGMNYIAGYLFIKTKEEQSCYRLFEYLMEERFKELFANEFQVLKIKMYQFQRLLTIYHPQISQHFKRQQIVPECYIISWIITMFASSYQYTMESYLIDLLWERFIIWGWRQFFKFVLWLFSLYKEQIIQMTYDKALHFFGDLVKSSLFLSDRKKFLQDHKNITNIDQGIEKYHVSDQLLENLKKEYYLM